MATTLEITPEYFISGDFDSRNRYLKQDAAGSNGIVTGITWEIGSRAVSAGSSWLPYRYALSGIGSSDFTSYTYNSTTTSQSVTAPSNIVTRVSF